MSEKLKPCPFCGGKPEICDRAIGYAAVCANEACGSAFTNWRRSKDDADLEWNTRAPQNEWISVDDRLPIDINNVYKFESMEVLIVSGGKAEYCEFTCGNLPSPWFKFEDYHIGFITHWMPLPTPPKEI